MRLIVQGSKHGHTRSYNKDFEFVRTCTSAPMAFPQESRTTGNDTILVEHATLDCLHRMYLKFLRWRQNGSAVTQCYSCQPSICIYVPFTEVLIQKYFTPSAMNHLSRLPLIFSLNVTNFEFLSFGWPSDEP